jgi:purine catabolism regulator
VHVLDIPDPSPWAVKGQLMLSTGYAGPRSTAALATLLRKVADAQVAGIGLGIPRYLAHFPPAMRQAADRAGVPLLEIPWEIPFAQICSEVTSELTAGQGRIVEQATLLHRTLCQAAVSIERLQDLATVLGTVLRRPVAFEDGDGRLLGFHVSEHFDNQAGRGAFAMGQTHGSVLKHLQKTGAWDSIMTSPGALRIPGIPELGVPPRVVCPIRIKTELVGSVWVIEDERPLTELDLRGCEYAAGIAAVHIAHQRHIAATEARLGQSMWDSMLSGQFEASPYDLERAQLLGFDLGVAYRVVILELKPAGQLSTEVRARRERVANLLRHKLSSVRAPKLMSMNQDQIVFPLPVSMDPEVVCSAVMTEQLAAAAGRGYLAPSGIRRSYLEACSLRPYLETGKVRKFENVLLPRVLAGDSEAQAAFLEDIFGVLGKQKNGQLLVQTLLILARSGFSHLEAAKAMHIHPNTIHYRTARAQQIAGIDVRNPETRFRLQLAAHLMLASNGRDSQQQGKGSVYTRALNSA